MNSKEIIKRIVAHDAPPRIGYDFADQSDLAFVGSRCLINVPENPYSTSPTPTPPRCWPRSSPTA